MIYEKRLYKTDLLIPKNISELWKLKEPCHVFIYVHVFLYV